MDRTFRMNDFPREVECIACGSLAKKILSVGHGGLQTDGDVNWLSSACKVLQRTGERELETRGEWRQYLKDNGLIAAG